MTQSILAGRRERAEKANELIKAIASCGRKVFLHNRAGDEVLSRFEIDPLDRIWFRDGWTGRAIFMHQPGYAKWRGFTEGGTMRFLIQDLRRFIQFGTLVHASHFGPWPQYICGGDLWGYGEDMAKVREAAKSLGICETNGGNACAQSHR
jgi:hypothetical protein